MNLEDLVKNIINETAVSLTEEFDRNFERKAFFDQKWPTEKHANSRGSQMLRSGKLRKSENHRVSGGQINWRSSLPYATIHNEGGEMEVTEAMKSFFWAMYYKASGGASGGGGKTRVDKLTKEAEKWKYMALMKAGTKMKVEQKQFIGWHERVNSEINNVVADNMIKYNDILKNKLKDERSN
ncbi:MAG: hypothetical protein JJE55_08190 [Flavobacteriaceae bacterium]|nr:hypothetical protein [Flavobacteriaceae bacterium]